MTIKNAAKACCLVGTVSLLLIARSVGAVQFMFSPGDLVVSMEDGQVQWRLSDGTLVRTLVSTMQKTLGEGMAFDRAGNLYVARWCVTLTCLEAVEKFDIHGLSMGPTGTGYNCRPHAVVFDARGNRYVGQASCTGSILKFAPGSLTPTSYAVAADNRGAFWIDLAADGCTMFYTSWGPNVKRFNVCTGLQLPDFNAQPLPGGETQDLRVLPDGGVLVSSGSVIARLDAAGALVQTYGVAGEPTPWAGLDLVGDGTFWAGNYYSSNVYRFDLSSGAVLSRFNTGVPLVVGVRVMK